jgi:hypothetical protein
MAFDDLYVLSLPAFVWIKLYPSDTLYTEYGHHSMTCDIVNGTQMIVMGGSFPDSTVCDAPVVQAQHSADLGKINEQGDLWINFNQDNPPYRLPNDLTSIIGGT